MSPSTLFMPTTAADGNRPTLKKGRRFVQGIVAALLIIHFLISQQKSINISTSQKAQSSKIDPSDASCPFRDSPLYRSIYIYPTPDFTVNQTGAQLHRKKPAIYSSKAGGGEYLKPYPWLHWDNVTKTDGWGHYDVTSQMGQYTLELIVRDMITHPDSCLATTDPEDAKLFYVPYLPSMEFHKGRLFVADYSTSVYGKAIYDALEGDYEGWEKHFGFTSKYWRRNKGADHILVWSEPLHGFSHPRMKRGNFHYIHTQRLLRPAIGIVVEVSKTFVEMYPKCAAKNVLVPYPNPDGQWVNGHYDREASKQREIEFIERPVSYWYSSGNHGSCASLRRVMQADYKCTKSYNILKSNKDRLPSYSLGMRLSNICPCPGGDSPSAKRNFDSVLAGCIPLILSHDFVWPFSKEFDPEMDGDPSEFSIRLTSEHYSNPFYNDNCTANHEASGLPSYIESIINNVTELERLQNGVKKAGDLYSFYRRDADVPDNPLRAGILPDGGAVHALLNALASRAGGSRWSGCENELAELPKMPDINSFKC